MFLPRLIHYTSPLDEWQLIVTMATELSLIGRVDTEVRNKALLAPWGCRVFEQVSAMLLAGCPGKKMWKKMWRRCRHGTSEVRRDSNRTHLVFQLTVCFWVLRLPLFSKDFKYQCRWDYKPSLFNIPNITIFQSCYLPKTTVTPWWVDVTTFGVNGALQDGSGTICFSVDIDWQGVHSLTLTVRPWK